MSELTEQEIDAIVAEGGFRNAAGGIYSTSVYKFARAIQKELESRTPEPGQPEAAQPVHCNFPLCQCDDAAIINDGCQANQQPSQPEQGDSWFRVEVSHGAGQIVAIESEMLAGRGIGEHEEEVIRKAIAHLNGFICAGLYHEQGDSADAAIAHSAEHGHRISADKIKDIMLAGLGEQPEAEPVADSWGPDHHELAFQIGEPEENGEGYFFDNYQLDKFVGQLMASPAPRAAVPDKLQELANRVCRDLPDGMEIQLCMENGAAYIDLISPRIEVDFEECPDSSLSARIEDALQKAIAAAPEQGGVG